MKTKEGAPRTLGLNGINTTLFPSDGLVLYTSDWGSKTQDLEHQRDHHQPRRGARPPG